MRAQGAMCKAVAQLVILYDRELGVDQGDSQGTGGVPPLGGATNYGDDGKTRGRRRVGVPIGRGCDVSQRDPSHQGVHQEDPANHSGKGGLLPRPYTLYRGGADAGSNPAVAMVGSRRGKQTVGIDKEGV